MAFYHGVKTSEQATSVIAPVQTTAGLPVVFGTAPVHLTEDPSAVVNKPIICYSWEEAVQQLGYSEDWAHFTLCEAMYAQFKYLLMYWILLSTRNPLQQLLHWQKRNV